MTRRARFQPRRRFAAPFVITLALAPACGGGQRPDTEPPPNAPDPPTTTAGDPLPTPEGAGTWTQIDGAWVFAFTDDAGAKIYLAADGTCVLESDGGCGQSGEPSAEPMSCNPPPPQQVGCPAGLPAGAQNTPQD